MTKDWSEVASNLLETQRQNRASVGLSQETDLTPLQVATLYEPTSASAMLADGVECDLHSACGLGLTDEIKRLANSDSFRIYADMLPPLGFALLKSQVDAVSMLLESGDDPNQKLPRIGFFVWEIEALNAAAEDQFWRPIHMTSTHGYSPSAPQMIDQLIDYGADVDSYSVLGEQPIHLASTYGWDQVMARLFEHGVGVNSKTRACSAKVHALASPSKVPPEYGMTPLMITAREGKADAIADLIHRGADPHAKSSRGRTALHVAADAWWGSNEKVVTQLLKAGSDTRAMDVDGKCAIDYARGRKYSNLVRLLIGT